MQEIDLEHTFYDTLGINRKASAEDVKAAYLRLTKRHHPDAGGDVAVFAAINVAYGVLRGPQRHAYDQALTAESAPRVPVADPTWEPEEWLEDEVTSPYGDAVEDDVWREVEVPERNLWLEHDVAEQATRRPPAPPRIPERSTYTAVGPQFRGANGKRAVAAALMVLGSLGCSIYGAPAAGVSWVVWVSFLVFFIALLRACALEWFGLVGALMISALIVWGAYADDELLGAAAAAGVLAPGIIAGELLGVRARAQERAAGR